MMSSSRNFFLLLWAFVAAAMVLPSSVDGFQTASLATTRRTNIPSFPITTTTTALSLSNEKPKYSREVLLREEAESPFRKVRLFFYAALGAGALVSLVLSLARTAAGLAGINAELLQESLINAAIDSAGLAVLSFLWRQDLKAQDSRLKRASKGAELARLMVRGSKSMIEGYASDAERQDDGTFQTSLASLRRGRGIEKRVVIAAGGKEKIAEVLKQATELRDSLTFNDLLVVPVLLPQAVAPPDINPNELPECVALPVGPSWKVVVDDEAQQAESQGIDVTKEGVCVILKKNGRVGQRTRGIYLGNMVGEVTARREAGMDVKNI